MGYDEEEIREWLRNMSIEEVKALCLVTDMYKAITVDGVMQDDEGIAYPSPKEWLEKNSKITETHLLDRLYKEQCESDARKITSAYIIYLGKQSVKDRKRL